MAEFQFPRLVDVALEIRAALGEQRIDDAKRLAIKHLKAVGDEFSNAVAELLEVKKETGVVGRKQLKYPKYWLEIGSDYLDLRASERNPEEACVEQAKKYNYEEACAELAKKYDCSESTIKNTVRFFEKLKEEHDKIE